MSEIQRFAPPPPAERKTSVDFRPASVVEHRPNIKEHDLKQARVLREWEENLQIEKIQEQLEIDPGFQEKKPEADNTAPDESSPDDPLIDLMILLDSSQTRTNSAFCEEKNIRQFKIKGADYYVQLVPKDKLGRGFGRAWIGANVAVVRDDLPLRVSRFVTQHELWHCQDKTGWSSWVARELYANFQAGIRDPIGLVSTIAEAFKQGRHIDYWNEFRFRGFRK